MRRLIPVLILAASLWACAGASPPPPDAGAPDAGPVDAGPPDAGPVDAGLVDAGPPDAGATTYANFAQDFFQTYCLSCHTPGGQGDPSGSGLDFSQRTGIASHAATIRCGTAVSQDPAWSCASFPPAKQFPICDATCSNPQPTDAERDQLVAWIDAGLP